MIVFPNCKINLGLYIGTRRADGFHQLQTAFYPVPLSDALEVLRAPDQSSTTLTCTGLPIAGPVESLSPFKAWSLLKRRFAHLPEVSMYLHKVIPSGAGLGGGSADGAFALKLLNRKFNLGLSDDELLRLAAELGSDCPFFIHNRPAYAEGRGELLEPVDLDLRPYRIVLVNPGIHVSTAWAFAQVEKRSVQVDLRSILAAPATEWKDTLFNDFEEPVMQAHPEIRTIKEQLYEAGAVYASMSGSGSTVFGLFSKDRKPDIAFPAGFFVFEQPDSE